MVEKLKNTKKAKALFGDWEETLILSCMQEIMGEIYVDNQELSVALNRFARSDVVNANPGFQKNQNNNQR